MDISATIQPVGFIFKAIKVSSHRFFLVELSRLSDRIYMPLRFHVMAYYFKRFQVAAARGTGDVQNRS